MGAAADYKKHADYGPGGRKCPCCGPSPKDRVRFDRTVRRVERRIAHKEMRDEAVRFLEESRYAS